MTTRFDELHPDDAAALDALLHAGLDPEAVAPELRQRARTVGAVLELLRAGAGASSDAARRAADAMFEHLDALDAPAALTALDAEALDSWIQHGQDAARVPGVLRERALALEALAGAVLGGAMSGGRDARIERVLAAAAKPGDESAPLPFSQPRWGWREVVSLAAMMLLGTSVAWPMLAAARHSMEQSRCAAHLGRVAMAMGGYGYDHAGSLPMAAAGFGGGTWWNVGAGRGKSNSANLYTLVGQEYAPMSALACPGNAAAPVVAHDGAEDWRTLPEVSYSYRIPSGTTLQIAKPVRFVVLADRSPVVPHAIRGEPMRPDEPSPNHRGRGQHVLWSDGAVQWAVTPVLTSGDNLWLPASVERAIATLERRAAGTRHSHPSQRVQPIRGVETPESVNDAFVGP